ncbi:MAG: formyltransferase [Syntrophus sp. (in: bacteria)]|nr:formyltransferase [Syntrophus sp. (in: bacteria)]
MKSVVFAYHNMGLAGLKALQRADYNIACIFSHQDDPNENCWFGSVEAWAAERAIPVYCPTDVNQSEWIHRITDIRPDMIFSFYYRRMLTAKILDLPPLGAYNLHGSYLPSYRGRCPVNWVLVNGETKTGVTLHHMVKKADAGDIVGQRLVSIEPTDTAVILYRKLCDEAGKLLDEVLPLMKAGEAPRIPQDITKGSYYGGRNPEDGRIDWRWSSERIYNLIRAVTAPYPGAFCILQDGSRLLIWWATQDEKRAEVIGNWPGQVHVEENRVFVQTGQGRIRLFDVEDGDKRMTGDGLIQYFKNREGIILS